jgi:hypothetical protein
MNDKPTHTPGPWRVSKESSTIIENGHGLILGSSCGYDDSGYFPSDQTAVVNARLIAAAPDFLEAAELHEAALAEPDHDKRETMLIEAGKLRRAAIAKAKP